MIAKVDNLIYGYLVMNICWFRWLQWLQVKSVDKRRVLVEVVAKVANN